ncbi:PQQ-dependent sugar dehydrogenase [Luteolibacter ambystomatis]|uniref:PQQ-dependent sugar dehydrogenase n=1 Tax=Luteolibacter ambystomatis TaxID=2824561 RepID=A0A975IZ54_9BACT|nr:PQQ-dependent sugar dehydrogenase [Luteolibacter ambystomatis]QUE50942.1 PQQ-dependent sugar dehydrogenase [Luteolibacter ambystomatis]
MFKPVLLSLAVSAVPLVAKESYELSAPVAEGLDDPIELTVLPNGDLFVIEREGRVLRVCPTTGGTFEIAKFDVSALRSNDPDSPVAREEGLLGITLDPKFAANGRLYIYYSDPVKTINRLSRFVYRDGKIDRTSEKMLLEIPVERDRKVCHQGGSLAFGPDGLLYLSTGDNTNPFESNGYAPIDNRPDRVQFDAQRSSGNTNDLRGKVLRIRPTEDGYEIPAGNLFPKGTAKTRPEIYVMGCRNPYRISLDPKVGTLYWGEVGPDAGDNGPRGPRGYDEVNQARKAGNYGWPFVIANNLPYPIVDFTTGQPGGMTDPAAPKNPGARNTGLPVLPPANSAFIWYPYADSPEFPVMGKGSRNAMAGPVFYYNASRKWNILGKEDDHTLLTYDWARGRIWKAKLGEGEKLVSLTPFADKLVHPIDMEQAADGTIWVLEYGTNWWFNKDGRVRRLRPGTDNRAPELAAEAVAGQPGTFTVKNTSDADGDTVFVHWFLTTGAGEKDLGTEATVKVAEGSGTELRAVAADGKGGVTIKRFPLVKQDAQPALALELEGKPKSLGFGETVKFQVKAPSAPDAKTVSVRARYIPPTGHDAGGPEFAPGIQELVTSRLCLACHQVDQASVGPKYVDVALRYRDRADAVNYLKDRVLKGSTGDWGEVPMPAQAISEAEADKIVKAILHLGDGISATKGTLSGELKLPAAPANAAPGGAWEITAEATGYLTTRARVNAK